MVHIIFFALCIFLPSLSTAVEFPFRYLNQYFYYEVDDEKIYINNKTYNLKDLEQQEDGLRFVDSLAGFSAAEKIENCYQLTNEYTTLALCLAPGALPGAASITKPEVIANAKTIEDRGIVVLNDQNQQVEFKVTYANGISFVLKTIKRVIIPAQINKSGNSDKFNVLFVDKNNIKKGWNEELTFETTEYSIRLDNLISLRQEIIFKDESVLYKKVISETYIAKPKDYVVTYNKLSVEPFGTFFELTATTNTLQSVLRSRLSQGVAVSYAKSFAPLQEYFAKISYQKLEMIPDRNQVSMLNNTLSLAEVNAGYLYYPRLDLFLKAEVALRESLSEEEVTATTVRMTKQLNTALNLGADYAFFHYKNFSINAEVDGSLLLPAGFDVSAGVNTFYKINSGKLLAGLDYGTRFQTISGYKFEEKYLKYRFAFTYFF